MGSGRDSGRGGSKSGPGRSELGSGREQVFADFGPDSDSDPWDDDYPDGGAAGVREPRRPLPNGPLSGAAELPLPEPPAYLVLSDPRR